MAPHKLVHPRPLLPSTQYLMCVAFCLPLNAALGQFQPGQQLEFELRADGQRAVSQAFWSEQELRILSRDDGTTVYRRDARLDSEDGRWLAYVSRNANQVIRWPISHAGHLQIGRTEAGRIAYRTSQMKIYALDHTPQPSFPMDNRQSPIMPAQDGGNFGLATLEGATASPLFEGLLQPARGIGQNPLTAQMVRLASFSQAGSPMLLSRLTGSALGMASSMTSDADWWATPVGNGYVRLQTMNGGLPQAITVSSQNRLTLSPVNQQVQQLWRVSSGRVANRFVLESAAFPGRCLAYGGGGNLMLQPIGFAPPQLWAPFVPPVLPSFEPFWRSVNSQIIPQPALPPAQLELVNSHKYALVLLLGDSRYPNDVQQIRLEPGSSQVLEIERDAGATIVETVEIRSPSGVWDRQEFVTEIPPQTFYDLSVYEEHLQSIAIDATGKSPNPIEDVNYVPKSVGWLPLPGGQGLPDYAQLDVYSRALAAKNPGAVRRLDPKQFEEKADENPLERILDKFQSTPKRKF